MTSKPDKPSNRSFTAPARFESRRWRAFAELILFTLGIAILSLALSGLFRLFIPLSLWKLFRRSVSFSSLAMLLIFMRWLHREPLRTIGLVSWREGRGLLFAGLGLGIFAGLTLCGVYLSANALQIAINANTLRVISMVTLCLPAMALVAVLEELVFRGYLLRILSSWSLGFGVVASSLIYALVHLKTTLEWPSSAFEVTGLFILGVVLALGAIKTQQLWMVIGLHAAFAYFARINKMLVEFTHPQLHWLVGTSRLVNGVGAWLMLLVIGLVIIRFRGRAEGTWLERRRRIARILIVLVLACLSLPVTGWSEDAWAPKSYAHGCARKLGRGVANILSAPLELVRKPVLVGRIDGGFAALTAGLADGLRAFGERELAGMIETATFAFPFPGHDFRPLVEPEFIYANGAWVE